MTADEALVEAFQLGMDEAGWTDAVMDRAAELLPTLVAAGYAVDNGDTWHFSAAGVARMEELEAARED